MVSLKLSKIENEKGRETILIRCIFTVGNQKINGHSFGRPFIFFHHEEARQAYLAIHTAGGVAGLAGGLIVYSILHAVVGIRLNEHDEIIGPDLSIHNIEAYPEESL